MGKRLLEWWGRLKEWMDEGATTAFLSVLLLSSVLLFPLLVLSSLWVMFGDTIGYDACWIYKRLGVTEKAAALKTLGFTIAGIVAFWGVMAANRRSDAMAKSANAATESAKAADNTAKANAKSAKAADNTANVAEAGNRQRAFQDGLKHLGSDKASVRLIGARALFYVAMEDEKQRAAIASFLCAYIRETTGDKGYQEENKDKPSTEVQSLLKLLFTTETMDEGRLTEFWQDITPDLNGGYFRGVELENAWFRGAELRSAQFKGAKLTGARFQETQLDRAQFQRAWLSRAQFQGAWMRETRFHAADLTQTQFQGADLALAQFQGARLSGSKFQGALLWMAGLQQARLGEEHGSMPAQGHTAAGFDDLVKQLKASAFHGVSSGFPDVHESFEKRIKDRTNKQSDFSEAIFSGGVTEELLEEVKAALEVPVDRASWSFDVFDDPDFKEKLIRNLESEIGQPEGHTPPKGVIAGSYGKEDAERWIREFREAMETARKPTKPHSAGRRRRDRGLADP